jgi:hypothetical protein
LGRNRLCFSRTAPRKFSKVSGSDDKEGPAADLLVVAFVSFVRNVEAVVEGAVVGVVVDPLACKGNVASVVSAADAAVAS